MYSTLLTKQNTLFSLIFSIFLTSFIIADPTDGCELDTNTLFITSEGNVLYKSDVDIAGFQFTVDGATVESAAGGDAAANGFTVSASGT
ncbi:uncharacterized protein METZ01_LOCUS287255, partial [marine metagenome]